MLALAPLCARADEAADRQAIAATIGALNDAMPRAVLFTADSDARLELNKLLSGKKLTFKQRPGAGKPTVVISSEPWREAQIVFPAPVAEVANPRIVSGAVRFLTDDVALVDASLVDRSTPERQATPLLFVMKRDGDVWRIASMRTLAAI